MSHILLYTYAASIFINSYVFYEDFPDYYSLKKKIFLFFNFLCYN